MHKYAALSYTQRKIFDLLCKGKRCQTIADELGLSKTNVDTILWRMRKQHNVKSNVQLVLKIKGLL